MADDLLVALVSAFQGATLAAMTLAGAYYTATFLVGVWDRTGALDDDVETEAEA